jgi:hypothetical protein
MYELI